MSKVQEAYAMIYAKPKHGTGWSNWFVYSEQQVEQAVIQYHKTHDVEVYIRRELDS